MSSMQSFKRKPNKQRTQFLNNITQKLKDIVRPPLVGIDLGTANSIVILHQKGIIAEEPTLVAIDITNYQIVAVGNEAKYMLGKSPESIVVKRPLQSGVISNARVTQKLVSYLLNRALGRIRFKKPEVMISTPVGITSVEKRAVIKTLLATGAKRVYLIPEPLAAAIGAKLPIHESFGNMIINMGGGTVEVAVISLNGIVIADSIRIAGDRFNEDIIHYARKKMNLRIGIQMAEKIKIQIGSALPLKEPLKMEISGTDMGTGLPTTLEFTSNHVAEALRNALEEIVQNIRKILEKTPPELVADIKDHGIVLTGGTAQLRNIDTLFAEALGLPVYIADDPLHAVINGIDEALNYVDVLKKSLTVF